MLQNEFGLLPARIRLIDASNDEMRKLLPAVIWLFAQRLTLGSSKDNGALAAPGISKSQIGLSYSSASGWRVRDLDSRNGTQIGKSDGSQLADLAEDPVNLVDGDDLYLARVAQYRFELLKTAPKIKVTMLPPDGIVERRTTVEIEPARRAALLLALLQMGTVTLEHASVEVQLDPSSPPASDDDYNHTIVPSAAQQLLLPRKAIS